MAAYSLSLGLSICMLSESASTAAADVAVVSNDVSGKSSSAGLIKFVGWMVVSGGGCVACSVGGKLR